MDAQTVLQNIATIQGAFQVLTMLQLTAHNYPPPATVINGSVFDFIIVGAGTAGCVLARRLVEDKKTKVLLIEAGGDPPFQVEPPSLSYYLVNSSVDWNYTMDIEQKCTECNESRTFDLELGKMLGGTSAINYVLYNEGYYRDYDQWAIAANDSSWKGKAVLPFFIKSQRLNDSDIENSSDGKYFGYKGPIILTKDRTPEATEYLEGLRELGYPIIRDSNIKNTVGYTSAMFNFAKSRKQHTARTYLTEIRKYNNLHMLKNTLVIKINFDHKKNAESVLVRADNGNFLTLRASKEIIVCAGAINTPKLLLLSGIGPKQHLKTHGIGVISNLQVGKNLIDQNAVVVVHDLRNTKPQTEPKNPNEYPASVFIGFISLNESETQPEYTTINYINYQSDLIGYSARSNELSDQVTNSFFSSCKNKKGIDKNKMLYSVISKVHAKSRGEVKLTSSNYSDPPKIRPGYDSENSDLDVLVKYLNDFIRVGKTKFFKKLGAVRLHPNLSACKGLKKDSTEYWRCYVRCVSFPKRYFCGTCAMGSVVDGKLRVYGVKRLRVVDASIMPNTVTGGTLGAVVMTAEKAAHMIKKEYNL